ncbi:amidohydrolase family protein [Pseudorhodoferax sp.]|uniref:amidohydrolase family protein n=1 Tax=Pseudorhodoferax sp. TaxID=1993553 RepID=UPI0039E39C00
MKPAVDGAGPARPSRRTVFGHLAAALAAGLAGTAHAEEAAAGAGAAPATCACGLVDAHSHYLPPQYARALDEAGLVTLDGGFPVPAWSEEQALQHMDRHGIEVSMLSVSSPTVGFVRDALARRRLARSVNTFAAELVRRKPDRFGAFATLPLPDVPAALEEIAHALDVLQLDGVVMETNVHGIYLGDARLDPLFAELDRRRATLFLHPTSPPCLESVGLGRPAPILEFPMDTARTIADLLFAGTLTRYPRIRVIVPHAGGALSALAERIAAFSTLPFLPQRPAGGAQEVRSVLRALYYDLAGSASDDAIVRLRQLTTLDHVLFGSDFPFTPASAVAANVQGVRTLRGLSRAEHEGIARGNALRLFTRLAERAGTTPTAAPPARGG